VPKTYVHFKNITIDNYKNLSKGLIKLEGIANIQLENISIGDSGSL
jgi:hypothetical protein